MKTNAFTKFVNGMNKVYTVAAIVFLIILAICCVIQVVSRKLLNGAISGMEEGARYAFIWMNMLGASLCVAKGSHATVELLNNALKGKAKAIHSIITTVLVVGISIIFVVYGVQMAILAKGQLSPTIHIDMSIMYFAVVVFGFGATLNGINNIIGFVGDVKGKKGGAEA